ncbi:PIR protein [Plasmodium ovale]|uniref:PIR protein n=1 Tax=Plasmodium ovale TaxID=36330 RepID=A0A1D3JEQ0_PLAOA|nr:PIR protein [Plasmodium ovale]
MYNITLEDKNLKTLAEEETHLLKLYDYINYLYGNYVSNSYASNKLIGRVLHYANILKFIVIIFYKEKCFLHDFKADKVVLQKRKKSFEFFEHYDVIKDTLSIETATKNNKYCNYKRDSFLLYKDMEDESNSKREEVLEQLTTHRIYKELRNKVDTDNYCDEGNDVNILLDVGYNINNQFSKNRCLYNYNRDTSFKEMKEVKGLHDFF